MPHLQLATHLEPGPIPGAGQDAVAGEELPKRGVFQTQSFVHTVTHDVEQRLERRNGLLDGPVVEIVLGHPTVGRGDVVHRIGVLRGILLLGAQHAFDQDGVGVVEHPPQEVVHELRSHAPPQTTGRNRPPLVGEICDPLQIAVGDEEGRIAFGDAHAAPDFGDQQAHVVIHSGLGSEISGTGEEHRILGNGQAHEGGVEIVDRRQGVERALGQRSFTAGAGRGGRFAGHAGDELHERLGQFHVMDRPVAGQRAHPRFGGIVPAPGQDRMHRRVDRTVQRQAAGQPSGHVGEMSPQIIQEIGPDLEVPRILGRLSVHQTRVGGDDDPLRRSIPGFRGGGRLDQAPHGRGVLIQGDGIVDDVAGLLPRDGLVVAEEAATAGKVGLGGLVVPAMDGVVGALEQPELGVLHELERRMDALRIQPLQLGTGNRDTGGDVVLHLQLEGRDVVLAEAEGAPGAIVIIPHAQELGDQALAPQSQFVGGGAVDHIDTETGTPVVAPRGLPEALHDQDEFADVRRNRSDPDIVFVAEIVAGRQQLDDRTQSAPRAENGPLILTVAGRIAESLRKIAGQHLGDPVEILNQIGDEDRAEEDRVGDRLGDLALAAAGDRAGLVAERALGAGSDQSPGTSRHRGRLQMHPEPAGQQVVMVAPQPDGSGLAGVIPTDRERLDVETGVLGHVDHLRETLVHRIPFGLQVHGAGDETGHLGEGVGKVGAVLLGIVFAAEIMTGEDQRSAGVFLFDRPEEVGGEADLGFDLLLAVAEVVVGDERDDHPGRVAGGQLEGVALVVEFAGVRPAHAVAALAFGGLVAMGQAHFLLGEPVEMRGQNDAAGMTTPVLGIEGRVVLGQ